MSNAKQLNEKLKKDFDDYKNQSTTNVKEQNKKFTTLNRERADLELEVHTTTKNEFDRCCATRKEHTLYIDKDKRAEEILKERTDKEVGLLRALIEAKTKERDDIANKQKALKDQYDGNALIQDKLKETIKIREEIFIARIDIEAMKIDQDNLAAVNEALKTRLKDLENAKQDAELKLEELREQVKASEEVALKKLVAKLNKDKSAEMKDKLAEAETLKEFNENMTTKLIEEKEKFDKLTDAMINRKEEIKILTAQLDDDTKAVDAQKAELAELNAKIDAEQKLVDELMLKVAEGRKVKGEAEEKSRAL
jgi:hypothetical protein